MCGILAQGIGEPLPAVCVGGDSGHSEEECPHKTSSGPALPDTHRQTETHAAGGEGTSGRVVIWSMLQDEMAKRLDELKKQIGVS